MRARGIVDKLELWEHSAKAISKIAPSEIKTWLGEITKGLSKDSYNKHLAVLRQIFETAVKDGRLFESPLQEVKTVAPDDPDRPCPKWKEARAIIKHIRAQRYNADAVDSGDFVEFMLLSGLGNGEAAALRWEDVDFDKNLFHVTRLKTGKKYPVPLFPSLLEFLNKLPKDNPDGRVLTISNARRAITKACERLGLPHYTQRSFRRCFITRAVEKGIDFKAISSWQGHQDGGVLIARTYSHLNDEHSQKMAHRL